MTGSASATRTRGTEEATPSTAPQPGNGVISWETEGPAGSGGAFAISDWSARLSDDHTNG